MKRFKYIIRTLLLAAVLIVASFTQILPPASAASIYDDIVQTTTSIRLRTSTAYCPGSSATEHNSNLASFVSTTLSEYNVAHSNPLADWEADWNEKTGWAAFSVTAANDQEYILVYYTTSGGGQSSFFSYGGADFFAVFEPSAVIPFRALMIRTSGDDNGNCNDTPSIGSASTGGLSLTANDFNGDYKLFMSTFPPTYPSGYEGAIIPSEAPAAKYVAMGDSFSSGEGNPTFEYWTDKDSVNECHRSSIAYPRQLQDELGLDPTAFVACAGATTDDVLNGGTGGGNWSEGPQVDTLSTDTEVATLTIGGNDLGFSAVMERCAYSPRNTNGWGCSNDTGLQASIDERMDALSGNALASVYEPGGDLIHSVLDVIEEIAQKAPNASIYIAGYPHLFGTDFGDFDTNVSAPSGASCEVWLGANFDYDDAQWINDGIDDLNAIIQTAVGDAVLDNIDITYVSPALFGGHANCDSSGSWIYPVVITDPPVFAIDPTSFHPTETGHSMGYKPAFDAYMN